MADVVFTIFQEHYQEAEDAIHQAIDDLLPEVCEEIIAIMQGAVPVDTSSLQQGFYYVTQDHDSYSDAVSAAESVNPTVQILDEVDAPQDDTHAMLANVTQHGEYIEFGTANMPARPFFFAAVDGYRDTFIDKFGNSMQKALDDALGR